MTLMAEPLKADGWTVYELPSQHKWAGTVQLPDPRNGHDSVSCYDFDTRTEAVDWCLDLAAMVDEAATLTPVEPVADRFPPAYPCQLTEPPA